MEQGQGCQSISAPKAPQLVQTGVSRPLGHPLLSICMAYLYSTQTAESTLSCLTDPTEQAAPAPSPNLRRVSAAQSRAGFAEKGQNGEGLELAFSPLTLSIQLPCPRYCRCQF